MSNNFLTSSQCDNLIFLQLILFLLKNIDHYVRVFKIKWDLYYISDIL
jgi:hypothetical protein